MKKSANLPKISIVTPSFNQGSFIKQCINSVLSQNYPNLEYIVMDGGSTDETVSILKSYGKKIQWVSKKDKGQTDALNKGFAKASGDIVAYLNSDDYFFPGTLAVVSETFQNNPRIQWITGDYMIVNEKNESIQPLVKWYKTLLRNLPLQWILPVANPVIQPSTFWRKSFHDEIGLFNENLPYCMDYDFWCRCIRVSKPLVLHQALSAFRIHAQSKGGSQFIRQFKEELQLGKKYFPQWYWTFLHTLHAQIVMYIYSIVKSF